jgi:hypothetical protein
MTDDRYIKAIIYTTVLAWTIVLLANHQALHGSALQPLSTVITVVVYAVMAFDLWLWKLPILHSWFVKRPVIDGTWKVTIRSNYRDPTTRAAIAPVDGYMVIRQTFSTLSLRLLTRESSSELVGTEIVCSADGLYCISGVYRNEPRFTVRDRSAIHYGAVWLRIIDEPTQQISGHYWTDRNTAGEIELTQRQRKLFQTFQEAQTHHRGTSGVRSYKTERKTEGPLRPFPPSHPLDSNSTH